ncbi:MAG: CDP-archaeol synthase [Candidatus Saccharimonadales bacterium]|nr:CDP-archaeol synthase [Candidatus Saccharimonadales bacterium]
MFEDILFIIYFALPGGLANMAPVFAAKKGWLPALNKPIDGGKTLRGKRLTGDHKTVRGFVVGFLFAVGVVLIQYFLFRSFQSIRDFSLVDYQQINLFVLAMLMTIGALGGDAIESFFKRQIGKQPGESWIPFDQIDTAVGLMIIAALYVDLPLSTWAAGLIIGSLLFPVSTYIAWLLKLKDSPL